MTYEILPHSVTGWQAIVHDKHGTHTCATFQPEELDWLRRWVQAAHRQGLKRKSHFRTAQARDNFRLMMRRS